MSSDTSSGDWVTNTAVVHNCETATLMSCPRGEIFTTPICKSTRKSIPPTPSLFKRRLSGDIFSLSPTPTPSCPPIRADIIATSVCGDLPTAAPCARPRGRSSVRYAMKNFTKPFSERPDNRSPTRRITGNSHSKTGRRRCTKSPISGVLPPGSPDL